MSAESADGVALVVSARLRLAWRGLRHPHPRALLLAPRVLPRDVPGTPESRRGLDLLGLLVLGASVTLFTVPLVLGQEEGWPAWGWICLALSAVLFATFVIIEARLARRPRRG